MVKFDNDPKQPSVHFNRSILWELPFIFVYSIVQIALVIGGIVSLSQGQQLQGLGVIGVAIFVCITFVWYWREWRGRMTTITITDGYVLIKERKRDEVVFEKRIIANQIHVVYCKRTWGRSLSYEVRVKVYSPHDQDQFICLYRGFQIRCDHDSAFFSISPQCHRNS